MTNKTYDYKPGIVRLTDGRELIIAAVSTGEERCIALLNPDGSEFLSLDVESCGHFAELFKMCHISITRRRDPEFVTDPGPTRSLYDQLIEDCALHWRGIPVIRVKDRSHGDTRMELPFFETERMTFQLHLLDPAFDYAVQIVATRWRNARYPIYANSVMRRVSTDRAAAGPIFTYEKALPDLATSSVSHQDERSTLNDLLIALATHAGGQFHAAMQAGLAGKLKRGDT